MNKNLAVVIGVILLVAIGGGAYMLKGKSSTTAPSTSSASPKSETALKSLKDLLLSGIPQKCTFTDKTENAEMDGVTYVSGGKMRGDFNSKTEGKMVTTHMIADGKTNYMWTSDQKTGIKMMFDPKSTETKESGQSTGQPQAGTETNGGVDLNKNQSYNCSPWGVDNSMFTPPADIKFTDYSAMFAPTGKAGTGVNPGCSACDSLEGDTKAQCKTALKCG